MGLGWRRRSDPAVRLWDVKEGRVGPASQRQVRGDLVLVGAIGVHLVDVHPVAQGVVAVGEIDDLLAVG